MADDAFEVKVTPRGKGKAASEPADDSPKPVTDPELLKKLEGDDKEGDKGEKPVTDPKLLEALEAAPPDSARRRTIQSLPKALRSAGVENLKKRAASAFKQMDPDVDYSGIAAPALRAAYAFEDTPQERKALLEEHFGKGNVTKDSFGRDVVIINGQKVAFLPRGDEDIGKPGSTASAYADVSSEVFPVTGMTLGAIAGAPVTLGPVPVGAIGGAGVGTSAGKAMNKLIKDIFLKNSQSFGEQVGDVAMGIPEGMAAQTLGEGGALIGRSLFRGPFREGSIFGPIAKKSREIFRQRMKDVGEARELGLTPRVGTYSPNASFTQRVQNAGFRLFGDYVSVKNRPILTQEAGKLTGGALSNTPAEKEVLSGKISERADQLVKTATKAADDAHKTAEELLKATEATITEARGAAPANLGESVASNVRLAKQAFAIKAAEMYAPLDALAGQPVVPTQGLKDTMEQILSEGPQTVAEGEEGKSQPLLASDTIKKFASDIAKLPDYISFQQMQVARATLRDRAAVEALNVGLSERQAARLARAADDAFDQAEGFTISERTIPGVEKPGAFKGTSLLQKIKQMGGIDPSYAQDITGESKMGTKGVPPGLFATGSWKGGKGTGLDDLATRLNAEGWDIDPNDTKDLVSKIQDEIAGREKYYSLADSEKRMESESDMQFFDEASAAGQAGARKEVIKRPIEGVEEAKQALRRADKFYAAGMKRFNDLTVESIVKDATTSGFVEPEKVAERVAQPGMVDRLQRMQKVVTPKVFSEIGAARWKGLLNDARNPLTGDVSGRRLAASLKKMGPVLETLYGKQEAARMTTYAENLAALNGEIPADALRSGQLSQVVQAAILKKEVLNETMKRGFVKALQSDGRQSLSAAEWLTEPSNRAELKQALDAFGAQSPEAKSLREYLARRIFSVMEVPATRGAEKYGTTELMGEPLMKELERYQRPYLEDVFGKEWTDAAFKFARQAEIATRKNPIDSGGLLAATLGLHWMRHLGEIAVYLAAGEALSTAPVITYLSKGIEFRGADFLQTWVGRGMQLGINVEAEDLPKKIKDQTSGYVAHGRGAFKDMVDSAQPRQEGGPVESGQPYVVGEKGPEVIVPSSSGTVVPNPDQLEKMDWASIYQLRQQFAGNKDMQEYLAPFEHQAYAREEASSSPASALAYSTLLVPGYQLAKMAGVTPTDDMSTGPSWQQFIRGMKGAGQGFADYLRTLNQGD